MAEPDVVGNLMDPVIRDPVGAAILIWHLGV
jgi:hypothetical protein